MKTRNENLNFINVKHIIKENSKNKPEPLTSKTAHPKTTIYRQRVSEKTHEIFRSTDLLLSAETLTGTNYNPKET